MSIQNAISRGRDPHPKWAPSIFDENLRLSGDKTKYWEGSVFALEMGSAVYRRHLTKVCRGALIDLGCGPAPLFAAYRNLVDWYYLVDWPSSIHQSKAIDHEMDLNGKLDLPDCTFDTIVMTSVLEHIRRPELLLSECARILRPNGTLFLQVPFAYWLHEEPYDYFRYTHHALRAMLEENELIVELIEPIGGRFDVLIDVLAKHLCSGRSSFRWAGRFLQAISLRRAALVRNSKDRFQFPLGYLVLARSPALAPKVISAVDQ